jgi:hypothetical protein
VPKLIDDVLFAAPLQWSPLRGEPLHERQPAWIQACEAIALTSVKLGPETAITPVTALPMQFADELFLFVAYCFGGPIAPKEFAWKMRCACHYVSIASW